MTNPVDYWIRTLLYSQLGFTAPRQVNNRIWWRVQDHLKEPILLRVNRRVWRPLAAELDPKAFLQPWDMGW